MKRYNFFFYPLLMAFLLGFAVSCDDDDEPDNQSGDQGVSNFDLKTTLSSAEDYQVEVYEKESPFVGFNRMAFRVLSAEGDIIDDANLELLPMMDMPNMKHSTPVEQPTYSPEDEAYLGSVTYVMPTTDMAGWSLKVLLQAGSMNEMDTLNMDPTVKEPEPARLFRFVDDGTKYFVAHREPTAPEVGMNPYGLMIYKRETMMSHPGVTGMSVALEPWMPSMDHGSENNVQPTEKENGYYEGEINFTMTGLWRIYVDVLNNQGDTLHSDSFDHEL